MALRNVIIELMEEWNQIYNNIQDVETKNLLRETTMRYYENAEQIAGLDDTAYDYLKELADLIREVIDDINFDELRPEDEWVRSDLQPVDDFHDKLSRILDTHIEQENREFDTGLAAIFRDEITQEKAEDVLYKMLDEFKEFNNDENREQYRTKAWRDYVISNPYVFRSIDFNWYRTLGRIIDLLNDYMDEIGHYQEGEILYPGGENDSWYLYKQEIDFIKKFLANSKIILPGISWMNHKIGDILLYWDNYCKEHTKSEYFDAQFSGYTSHADFYVRNLDEAAHHLKILIPKWENYVKLSSAVLERRKVPFLDLEISDISRLIKEARDAIIFRESRQESKESVYISPDEISFKEDEDGTSIKVFEKCYQPMNDFDKGLLRAGLEVCAVTKHMEYLPGMDEDVTNKIVFRTPDGKESEIGCTHTAITTMEEIETEELEEGEEPFEFKRFAERDVSTEGIQVNLSPEDHYFSLKSFVEGLLQKGIQNTMKEAIDYYREYGDFPFDFNRDMLRQMMFALVDTVPQESKLLVLFILDYCCSNDSERFQAISDIYNGVICEHFRIDDYEKLDKIDGGLLKVDEKIAKCAAEEINQEFEKTHPDETEHYDKLEEMFRRLALRHEGSVKSGLISNHTPEKLINDLAMKESDSLLLYDIARNPNLNEESVKRLVKSRDYGTRYNLARNYAIKLPKDVLEILSDDPEPHVKVTLTFRDDMPEDIWIKLAKDLDVNVRERVAESRYGPENAKKLAKSSLNYTMEDLLEIARETIRLHPITVYSHDRVNMMIEELKERRPLLTVDALWKIDLLLEREKNYNYFAKDIREGLFQEIKFAPNMTDEEFEQMFEKRGGNEQMEHLIDRMHIKYDEIPIIKEKIKLMIRTGQTNIESVGI